MVRQLSYLVITGTALGAVLFACQRMAGAYPATGIVTLQARRNETHVLGANMTRVAPLPLLTNSSHVLAGERTAAAGPTQVADLVQPNSSAVIEDNVVSVNQSTAEEAAEERQLFWDSRRRRRRRVWQWSTEGDCTFLFFDDINFDGGHWGWKVNNGGCSNLNGFAGKLSAGTFIAGSGCSLIAYDQGDCAGGTYTLATASSSQKMRIFTTSQTGNFGWNDKIRSLGCTC